MNTDTTTPDARRIAHRRVGGAATAAFLALLLLGALHQSADADTTTPATPSQSRPQQVQPRSSTPTTPYGGGSPQGQPSAPGDGGGRFWHHRGGGGFDGGGGAAPDSSDVAPSAPAPFAPSSGSTLDGSTT
jgi:hypothetical protein